MSMDMAVPPNMASPHMHSRSVHTAAETVLNEGACSCLNTLAERQRVLSVHMADDEKQRHVTLVAPVRCPA